VARQLFQQFAESFKQRLEVSEAAQGGNTVGQPASAPAARSTEPEAIRVVPLLLRALWSAIVRLWQRLVGPRDIPR